MGLIESTIILNEIGIKTSNSSISEFLKKVTKELRRTEDSIVCLDDFSLKKRHAYDSILIDYESRKVMDLFHSRSQENVSDWLATFIIRDGTTAFRNAISTACPDTIQISVRLHLLKSLTDHGIAAIHSLIPDKIKMSSFDSRPSNSYAHSIKWYSDSPLKKQK